MSVARGALTLAAALLFVPAIASADDPHPVTFRSDTDTPVLAAAGFAWLAGNLLQSTIVNQPSCAPCLPDDVNFIDRGLAGRQNKIADLVSWATVSFLLAAPLVADGIDVARSHAPLRSFADDTGVYAQALALDGAINEIIKLAVRRPRPLVYDVTLPDPERNKSDNYVSFYSEHTSIAFTAAAAYTTLFALHHANRRGLVAVVAGLFGGLAVTTAALRVVAGKHYYTDVVTGALVGTGIGVLVPLLHRRGPRLAVIPLEGGALATISLITP